MYCTVTVVITYPNVIDRLASFNVIYLLLEKSRNQRCHDNLLNNIAEYWSEKILDLSKVHQKKFFATGVLS